MVPLACPNLGISRHSCDRVVGGLSLHGKQQPDREAASDTSTGQEGSQLGWQWLHVTQTAIPALIALRLDGVLNGHHKTGGVLVWQISQTNYIPAVAHQRIGFAVRACGQLARKFCVDGVLQGLSGDGDDLHGLVEIHVRAHCGIDLDLINQGPAFFGELLDRRGINGVGHAAIYFLRFNDVLAEQRLWLDAARSSHKAGRLVNGTQANLGGAGISVPRGCFLGNPASVKQLASRLAERLSEVAILD